MIKIVPVIISGGKGMRLWPVSRAIHPKPFLKLKDGISLLQKSFQRAASLPNVEDIIFVTGESLFFSTLDEISPYELNKKQKVHFILEPFGKDTAPAIVTAGLYAKEHFGKDTILLFLAADHLIANPECFEEAVRMAVLGAKKNKLVSFGITPQFPETGYGYIEVEKPVKDMNEIQLLPVSSFTEKPDLKTAKSYIASKKYFWNSGMFCFSVKKILAEAKTHQPILYKNIKKTYQDSIYGTHDSHSVLRLDKNLFQTVESISIDYAIMEHSKSINAVISPLQWNDIGSWRALASESEINSQNNALVGDNIFTHDIKNCYIQSAKRTIGAVGLKDLIIVDTADALLVAHKDNAQDVKEISKQLDACNHPAFETHQTVHRPWGTYTVLEEGDEFKIKRIEVKPGGRLSLQMHHHRSEHWIIVNGMAKVTNGDRTFLLNTNESTYIPAGNTHRIENEGVIPIVMIEVQNGQYLGEDDIVRFEDKYGRAGS